MYWKVQVVLSPAWTHEPSAAWAGGASAAVTVSVAETMVSSAIAEARRGRDLIVQPTFVERRAAPWGIARMVLTSRLPPQWPDRLVVCARVVHQERARGPRVPASRGSLAAYEHSFEQVLDPFEHMLYRRTHVRSNV